jgi:type I restriction enzyme R subunit
VSSRTGYSDAEISRIKQQLAYYLNVREIVRRASGEILDTKPYEADMRHLIDTYINADVARKISSFGDMGLLELIVKSGIADAIAAQLGAMKGNKDAIAETIENNVRSKIIKEHLSDPAFYERMSALLDEIIALRKAKAIEYEEYLRRVAAVAQRVEAGQAEDTPEPLKNSPALRALYNNLRGKNPSIAQAGHVAAPPAGGSGDPALDLAIRLDAAVKRDRPDGWRDVHTREQTIKYALYKVLGDADEVERIFPIIKAQSEY